MHWLEASATQMGRGRTRFHRDRRHPQGVTLRRDGQTVRGVLCHSREVTLKPAVGMATNHHTRVDELFEAALAVPENARPAFLERACAGDRGLLAEVLSLLEHDRRAPAEFLVAPPGGAVSLADGGEHDDRLVGQAVGDFRIIRRLAVGGMGSVYEAEQGHPCRVVALKIMHTGLASRAAQRRFEHEAQILGRLRHPNIAQVYHSGIWEAAEWGPLPMPYFAMEHVPGACPITEYAEDRGLGVRERLRLFIQVCDAVHHGHQKGVIHRDLKPSNILIDREGCAKVIDFGVARCTDVDVAATTMHTSTGELVGTLQYMSPEQCAADPLGLDVRSDVYSLGVVLFELLTGGLPYDLSHKTIQASARIICEAPAVRPSALERRLRGNVDAILLRALDKNREQRYASVLDLAQDLQRHLSGEPIEARAPTLWARAARWGARHPFTVTAIGCCIIIGVAAAASWVSYGIASSTPFAIVTYPDRLPAREARVVAYNGKVLARWGPYPSDSIVGVELVPRQEAGSGVESEWSHVALLGIASLTHGATPLAGKLAAFGVGPGRSDEPLWTSVLVERDQPAAVRAKDRPDDFGIARFWSRDVFPDVEGEEILAVFSAATSRRVFRIYDLSGKVLYQFWHEGSIRAVEWLSSPGLLVFLGEDGRCRWDERGVSHVLRVYPWIVFAVRPKVGQLSTEYPIEPGVVWSLALLPPESNDEVFDLSLGAPTFGGHSVGFFVQLTFVFRGEHRPGVSLIVDAKGRFVAGAALSTDQYNRYRASLPDYRRYELGDIPECLPQQHP